MKSRTCSRSSARRCGLAIFDGTGDVSPLAMASETSANWESSTFGSRGGTLCVPPRWIRTYSARTGGV